MKVISGSLGGRSFNSKSRTTHPMSEKMRGAIFNSLGNIVGLKLLDAFSGSGALSFEAISRGASQVIAIESNKSAQKDIEANLDLLKLKEGIKLIKRSVAAWLEDNQSERFDIILIDPPYDKPQVESILRLGSFLNENGVLVLSFPPNHKLPPFTSLEKLTEKNYGDSRLVFYKNSK